MKVEFCYFNTILTDCKEKNKWFLKNFNSVNRFIGLRYFFMLILKGAACRSCGNELSECAALRAWILRRLGKEACLRMTRAVVVAVKFYRAEGLAFLSSSTANGPPSPKGEGEV